jgi:hypothetical protein
MDGDGGSGLPAGTAPWSVAPGRRSDGQVLHHRHIHVRLPGAFDPPLNLAQAVAERTYAPPYLSPEQRLPSQLRPLVIVNCGRAGSSA